MAKNAVGDRIVQFRAQKSPRFQENRGLKDDIRQRLFEVGAVKRHVVLLADKLVEVRALVIGHEGVSGLLTRFCGADHFLLLHVSVRNLDVRASFKIIELHFSLNLHHQHSQ